MSNPRAPLTAVYAGSFDPPTVGHVDLIERGARLFERLVVAVGDNPRKSYLFSVSDRLVMLAETLDVPFVTGDGSIVEPPNPRSADDPMAGVEVRAFDGLLVDFCLAIDASVILRGLRAVADFDYEFQLGLANKDLEPGIETVFLLTSPETLFVSSSIVKEIASGGRDVSDYVPDTVATRLHARLHPDEGAG